MRLLIVDQPAMSFEPTNFEALIAAGRKHGHWPEALVREHEEMAKRGKCFSFKLQSPPFLQGTLYEDNVWFSFYSADHQKACIPIIESLREKLDVRIHQY
jgi:hypothetical protein